MHIPTGRNVPGDVHFHRDIPDRLGGAVISSDFHKICISYKSALRGGRDSRYNHYRDCAQKTWPKIIHFIENDVAGGVLDILLTFLIYQKSFHNYTSSQDNTPKGERKLWKKSTALIWGTGWFWKSGCVRHCLTAQPQKMNITWLTSYLRRCLRCV